MTSLAVQTRMRNRCGWASSFAGRVSPPQATLEALIAKHQALAAETHLMASLAVASEQQAGRLVFATWALAAETVVLAPSTIALIVVTARGR